MHAALRRRVVALAGALAALSLALDCPGAAAASGVSSDSVAVARIEQHRGAGRFAAAARAARELLAARRADETMRPDQVRDAERLLQTLTDAAALPKSTRERLAEADRLHVEVASLFARGRYPEALEAVNREIGLREPIQGERHVDLIIARADLGLVHLVRGELDEAAQALERAHADAVDVLGADHPQTITILNSLAGVTWQRGDLDGAARLNAEVLLARKRVLGEDHPDVSVSLNNLGLVLLEKADYAASTAMLRESLAMKRRLYGDRSAQVAKGLNNLASVLDRRGQKDEALRYFQEALEIIEEVLPPDHPALAVSLNNVRTRVGDSEQAMTLLRRALAIQRRNLGPDHLEVVKSLVNMALETPDREESCGLLREALDIQFRVGRGEHPETFQAQVTLGTRLAEGGACAEAGGLLRRGAAGLERILGDAHWFTVTGLVRLSEWEEQCGTRVVAESLLTRAAHVADAARRREGQAMAQPEEFIWSPYSTAAEVYRQLARLRLALDRPAAAWEAMEGSLARATRDLVVGSRARFLSPREAAVQDSLSRELGACERRLGALRRTRDAARADVDAAEQRLLLAQAGWTDFQLQLEREHPLPEGQACSLAEVQSALARDAAILGWLRSPDHRQNWAFVIRKRGAVRWLRLPDREADGQGAALEEDVRELLADRNADPVHLDRRLRELAARRLEPVLPALDGIARLHVIPSGGMEGIPVEVLVDSRGTRVGERFTVAYAPSATLRTWLAGRPSARPGPPRTALVVGDPRFGREARVASHRGDAAAPGRLPASRREAAGVAALFPVATRLLGEEASEERVMRLAERGELAGFDVIHFATHALVSSVHPEQSAILLSTIDTDAAVPIAAGTAYCDGLVTAQEVMRDWKLDADLVSLSACRTGRGRHVGGEGYVGLAQAFLMAGARSLLVSLWDIDDAPTALLMERFFENWTGNYREPREGKVGVPMSKGIALREAKAWLSRYRSDPDEDAPFAHPFYWSGVVLVGRDD